MNTGVAPLDDTMEPLDAFRTRARAWLARNMPPASGALRAGEVDDEKRWARARTLQAMLYDGGFAGLCYPRAYGGQGLSAAHQRVFTEESLAYEMPILLNIPTLSICLPTILDLGTEAQRKQHVEAVLQGNEVLVEFLSEPQGGSDLAGVLTRADWNGTHWVINGSKIWTSHAYVGDYALCLARTDWDAPKHQGLTMFLVPLRHPGVTIRRIGQVNRRSEFCQEFLDNVTLGPEAVLGEVNGGWTVATRRFYHSRSAMGPSNPYISGDFTLSTTQSKGVEAGALPELLALARKLSRTGTLPDAVVDAYVAETVRDHLAQRIMSAVEAGRMPPEAASMLRLFHAEADWLRADAGLISGGTQAVTGPSIDDEGTGAFGEAYLFRQATSLGGGSTEMAMNVISERILRMPREPAADIGIPYREVRTSAAKRDPLK
jgi:alkylation response protein AidB-like acyl-CoA dehydrogenase